MNTKELKRLRDNIQKQFPANTDQAAYCFNVLLKHAVMHTHKPDYNEQSHMLLTGKTGSGKSHMIETIASDFDLPFITVDATALTESGYQGRSVEDVYRQLYDIAEKNCGKVAKAVVFIDEFDKLAFKEDESHDVSCRGVQYSLLKGMDGIDIPLNDIPQLNSRVRIDAAGPAINTRGILFVAAGSFSQCEYPVTRNSIITAGFYPELIARFSSVVHLDDVSEKQIRYLLDSNNLYLEEYEFMFARSGQKIVFTPELRAYIAMKAAEMDYNIRGLKIVIDELLIPVLDRINDPAVRTLTVSWSKNQLTLKTGKR